MKENKMSPQQYHGTTQSTSTNISVSNSVSHLRSNKSNHIDVENRSTVPCTEYDSTKVSNIQSEIHTNQTSSSMMSHSNLNKTLTSSHMPQVMKRHIGVKYTGATQWNSEQHTSGKLGQSRAFKKKPSKQGGTYFVLAVIFFIGFEYLSYTLVILSSFFSKGLFGIIYTVIFNILFFLMLLSFFKTSLTDPGVVPANWGFYMGEEGKRRRYCKVCHVWKPDRTHHCSACGRCVLNMDHHCPWVNNCIGFGNRKFFIQLLCYALLCVSSVMVHTTHFLLVNGSQLVPKDFSLSEDSILHYLKDISVFSCSVIMLLFAVLLGIPLIPFTKFHLTMISKNSSTIENMDVLNRTRGLYDLGVSRNLQQVLGPHWFLWWLPLHLSCSKPVGDGVRWRQHYWKAVQPG